MTGGPPQLNIGATQAIGTAVQSAFGTPATTGFTYIEWRTRAIKPVTGRKLYKTGAGVRGDERKSGRSKSNTGGTFSLALQNVQGVELIAYTFGCDDPYIGPFSNATTLNGAVVAGASSVVVASGSGYATNTGYIQIGPDATGNSEVRAIGTVSGTTINFALSETLTNGYATGVQVSQLANLVHATTLNGLVAAGASSVVVTSGTGYVSNTGYVMIGPDANGRSEVHKIGTVSGTTINFASPEVLKRGYADATAVAENTSTPTFEHRFSNALPPPFITIWLNRSGQWYQVQDVQLDKLALALTGDDEWMVTYTVLGGNGFTEVATPTPTFATDIDELNLADMSAATLLASVLVSDVAMLTVNVNNGVKQGFGGGSYYPTKQKEGEFTVNGDVDLFFDAAAVETMQQDTLSRAAGEALAASFVIGNHTINLPYCNFLEPDWTDTLAELNRVKDTYSVRRADSVTWTVSSTGIYLPYV